MNTEVVRMAMEYVNRKGDTYYLQRGKTKTGKPKYYFGRRLKAAGADAVPEGYEVYESPETAQVYVRKVQATAVSPMERDLVDEAIARLAGIDHAIVDVEPDALVVYLPDTDDEMVDGFCEVFGLTAGKAEEAREWHSRQARYLKMMRFTLVNADDRLFSVERWCFRGSIDNWIPLLRNRAPLEDLVNRFVPHLGRESFFELM